MGVRLYIRAALDRLHQFERREIREFRRWIEDTRNLIHVSILLFVPLLIGLVTFITNTLDLLPFLLFPPLASGTYTLFANPESRSASPRRFVAGMTAGAVCGWIALEVTARYWYQVPPESFSVNPGAAAFGVLLTGVVTWTLDIEESQSYSTALLVLVTGVTQLVYVVSVFISSSLIAGAFVLWRRHVYEQRADYLYQTTHDDDDVLVPMRGETAQAVAAFGARLGAAHEVGKVVLLDIVNTEDPEAGGTVVETDGGTSAVRQGSGGGSDGDALSPPVREAADRLEATATAIEERFDVPCEVAVAAGDPDDARTVVRTARETNCDLIVTPYEAENGKLSTFIRGLFASTLDVVAVRTDGDREEWRRILVPVKHPGDVAHAMLDFAGRLADGTGGATVCHCIDSEGERRDAEDMLANVAETYEQAFETRVADEPIEEYLARNAENYDLTIIGSSTERSVASRFIHPPTFRRLDTLDSDVAIVHRG